MAEPQAECRYCRNTGVIRRLDTATYGTDVRICHCFYELPEWQKVVLQAYSKSKPAPDEAGDA